MIDSYIKGQECCGCMLCAEVCPVNAIEESVINGFVFPNVNKGKCVKCQKCVKACPIKNSENLKIQNSMSNILISSNKSISEKKKSTSGAVFIELASEIMGGGTVYGAEYGKSWHVRHTRAIDECGIRKFQGSKYVQSRIRECYKQILEDLKASKTVLFSGTPCQVAAVKTFIQVNKVKTGKLITVEILCYGVPSPEIFQKHIEMVGDKYSEVEKYVFRDERDGWGHDYIHSARLKNGSELYNNSFLQAYASLFSKRLIFRESCFSCKFSSQQRCADITIGDCWGIEHIAPEHMDQYGVSQIWLNTDVGKELWDRVEYKFDSMGCTLGELLPYNTVLSKPADKPDEYNKFWKLYKKKGYEYVLRHFTRYGKTFVIRNKLKRLLEKISKV